MTNKLTVDAIRRAVDQYKDQDVTITTDGPGVYVANMANKQAIEVAKVLLAEIDRLQENNDKLMAWGRMPWSERNTRHANTPRTTRTLHGIVATGRKLWRKRKGLG